MFPFCVLAIITPTTTLVPPSPPELRRRGNKKSTAIAMDFGAGNQIRTDDLVITNDVLCQLSHTSKYSLRLDDLSIISNKIRFVNPFFQKF